MYKHISKIKIQKKKNKKHQKPQDKSNVYNPINSDWSRAWFITEKILNLINDDVKSKKKILY